MKASITTYLHQACQKDFDYTPYQSLDSLLQALKIEVNDTNPLQLNKTQLRILAAIMRHSNNVGVSKENLINLSWTLGEGEGSQETFNQEVPQRDLEELLVHKIVGFNAGNITINHEPSPESAPTRFPFEIKRMKRKLVEAKEDENNKPLGTAEILMSIKQFKATAHDHGEALKELREQVLEETNEFTKDWKLMSEQVLGLFREIPKAVTDVRGQEIQSLGASLDR